MRPRAISDFKRIADRAEACAARLTEQFPDIALGCDPDALVAAASEPGPEDTYRSFSPVLTAQWQEIRENFGEIGVNRFNRMLLCWAIATSAGRMSQSDMPEILKQEYEPNYVRILDRTESTVEDETPLSDDLLAKDLGLAAQRLFAAGYAIVERRWSMANRFAVLGGVRQFFHYTSMYYLGFRGSGPFLSNHFHPELAKLFTREGRIHSFRLIAEIMRWQPAHKALIGSAWFYDPVLAEISPNLFYVREYPEENGAEFFRGKADHSGNALVSSRRRQLYEEGKYHPRKYLMVWRRKSMLAWLDREFPDSM